MTSPAHTAMGIILGTAAYMAPEQARGRPIDKRVDIWTFGCVLFEMLTGKATFAGDNVTDTLAAVVRGEPDWTALPSDTPASIRRLLSSKPREDLMPLVKDPTRSAHAQFRVASGGYFGAMGIPLVRGRVFDGRDTGGAPHVAVISESLARKQWPAHDPIGVRIQFGGMDGDMTPFTIVGIVGDVREGGLDSQPPSMFYADYRQRPLGTFDFNVVLQTSVDSAMVIPAVRRILAEMAPEMPPRFRTVREAIDASTASRRFTLGLTGFFASAAMLLALLGVYGVLSYLVEQRRQEFGVRMALGARPSDVRRLVMKEAAWLVVFGLTLGVAGSLAAASVLEKVLFGVASTDVATYVGVTLALGVAALVAGQLPAIRATRVDPVKALHEA